MVKAKGDNPSKNKSAIHTHTGTAEKSNPRAQHLSHLKLNPPNVKTVVITSKRQVTIKAITKIKSNKEKSERKVLVLINIPPFLKIYTLIVRQV